MYVGSGAKPHEIHLSHFREVQNTALVNHCGCMSDPVLNHMKFTGHDSVKSYMKEQPLPRMIAKV